jgi:hypothetical protein
MLRTEQEKDPFCRQLSPGSYNSKKEFFYDNTSLIYRSQKNEKHQLLVPCTLAREVIRQNHEPSYAAHPGIRHTCELILLRFWWLAMRKAIEEFIKECDSCKRRKGDHEFTAPLGSIGNRKAPFEIVSMDITGPYPVTPRKKRYFLTSVDHFLNTPKYIQFTSNQPQHAAEFLHYK